MRSDRFEYIKSHFGLDLSGWPQGQREPDDFNEFRRIVGVPNTTATRPRPVAAVASVPPVVSRLEAQNAWDAAVEAKMRKGLTRERAAVAVIKE